jgi:hypothetical protein
LIPLVRWDRYAVSQTTLEQVFNGFAAQQEEEQGPIRGMEQPPQAADGQSETDGRQREADAATDTAAPSAQTELAHEQDNV